jgi:hypothetical protein
MVGAGKAEAGKGKETKVDEEKWSDSQYIAIASISLYI